MLPAYNEEAVIEDAVLDLVNTLSELLGDDRSFEIVVVNDGSSDGTGRVLEDLEDVSPDPLLGPAVKPPPETVPVAEVFGQVAPRGTRRGDPKDGIEEQAIVLGDLPMLAGLAGQEVLDLLPVGIFDRVAGWHCRPSMA